jgi:GNAT superfamily N-acetyltransferase
MSAGFAITSLTPDVERSGFRCGTEALDRYFREIVTQDIKRRVASCYVAREVGTGVVAGFYTLSASSVPLTDLPEAMRKKLPRYPSVPVARIGRLAVDERFKGMKLGAALLWDAIERAARSEVTVYGVAVDAKDEAAERFYRHFGFERLDGVGRVMAAPIASVKY